MTPKGFPSELVQSTDKSLTSYYDETDPLRELSGNCQWTTSDGVRFFPADKTYKTLTPGAYSIAKCPSRGIYFEKIPVKTDGLIKFPKSNIDKVVDEIKIFWDRESLYRNYNLFYKRGILLYGPPGAGKSCILQLVMEDVISRNGIVIKFTEPHLYLIGTRLLREIQPNVPIVVLMEDIDATIKIFNESEILNILDGIDQIDKVVYLATTNYPEELGTRIINRPSRFDKRFKISHPNEKFRKIYFKHLIFMAELNKDIADSQIERWVKDTEGLSLAHLKELFIAVMVLGDDYDDAINTLKDMTEFHPDSLNDSGRTLGLR